MKHICQGWVRWLNETDDFGSVAHKSQITAQTRDSLLWFLVDLKPF